MEANMCSAGGEISETGCAGTRCTATYVRARWRQRENGDDIEPQVWNVKVVATAPEGLPADITARWDAVERIWQALEDENKIIPGSCSRECSCVSDKPGEDEFVYSRWTITVDYHLGGRDPKNQRDRVDYRATFVAMRAEVSVEGARRVEYA
jgi:hypothetical protein